MSTDDVVFLLVAALVAAALLAVFFGPWKRKRTASPIPHMGRAQFYDGGDNEPIIIWSESNTATTTITHFGGFDGPSDSGSVDCSASFSDSGSADCSGSSGGDCGGGDCGGDGGGE